MIAAGALVRQDIRTNLLHYFGFVLVILMALHFIVAWMLLSYSSPIIRRRNLPGRLATGISWPYAAHGEQSVPLAAQHR
jgi:hypothetical protein